MCKTLDGAALDSFNERPESKRRDRALAGALESILASLDGDLVGAQRLRDTIRETATSALSEAGIVQTENRGKKGA